MTEYDDDDDDDDDEEEEEEDDGDGDDDLYRKRSLGYQRHRGISNFYATHNLHFPSQYIFQQMHFMIQYIYIYIYI